MCWQTINLRIGIVVIAIFDKPAQNLIHRPTWPSTLLRILTRPGEFKRFHDLEYIRWLTSLKYRGCAQQTTLDDFFDAERYFSVSMSVSQGTLRRHNLEVIRQEFSGCLPE
jgi:hypothetical protein